MPMATMTRARQNYRSAMAPQVVMGAPDWDATLEASRHRRGRRAEARYRGGTRGQKLTLGDTTVEIVPTPGHTPGTLSYVFPVKDQGRTVMVAYSGGH